MVAAVCVCVSGCVHVRPSAQCHQQGLHDRGHQPPQGHPCIRSYTLKPKPWCAACQTWTSEPPPRELSRVAGSVCLKLSARAPAHWKCTTELGSVCLKLSATGRWTHGTSPRRWRRTRRRGCSRSSCTRRSERRRRAPSTQSGHWAPSASSTNSGEAAGPYTVPPW
jgi:hypothetical protein